MQRCGIFWLSGRLLRTFFSAAIIVFVFMKSSQPSLFWLAVSGLIWALAGIETIRLTFNRKSFMWRLRAETLENRFEEFHLLIMPFIFIASFAMVCRELAAFDTSLFIFASEFESIPDAELWMGFMLDQAARAILLDVFETYRFDISSIDYSANKLLATFIFVYKTVLAVAFWRFVFLFYEHWASTLEHEQDDA